jgi:hypothetical protein
MACHAFGRHAYCKKEKTQIHGNTTAYVSISLFKILTPTLKCVLLACGEVKVIRVTIAWKYRSNFILRKQSIALIP